MPSIPTAQLMCCPLPQVGRRISASPQLTPTHLGADTVLQSQAGVGAAVANS